MTFKLDIFSLLKKINSPNTGDIWVNLTDEEKKGFAPVVVLRWLSGTSDQQQIIMLNTFANKFVIPLSKNPHLLMQVFQACSTKKGGGARWIGVKGGTKKTQLQDQVISEYFEYSPNELRAMIVRPSLEDIILMAEELGWQKDEMTKLKKEIKDAQKI